MRKWIIATALFAASTLVWAGQPPAAAPAVSRATLDNGLRVVIVHSDLAPVVSVNLAYLVGSNEAPAAFPGRAHALEHMMFRGSPGLSHDQLLTIAANLGGSYNATTSRPVTQYFFTVPAQDLDVVLHIEAARMRGLDLTKADWHTERDAIEQEVARDLSSPSYQYHQRLYKHLFAGTPYAHSATGTRAALDQTTNADLRRFYEAWYAPNNAILVIAGDIDAQQALASVRQLFGDIPRKKLPPRPTFDFAPVMAKTFTQSTDYSVPWVILGWRMPGALDPDFAAGLVLEGILSSSRGRLHALGLTGKALSGGFGTSVFKHAGIAYASASIPRGADTKRILDTLHGIVQDVAAHGVPKELFQASKSRLLASFQYKMASISGLAGSWVSALAYRHQTSPEKLHQALAAVTPAQVNALAKRIFQPEHAATIILTPHESTASTAGQGKSAKEHFGHPPSGPVELPAWAQNAFAELRAPQPTGQPVTWTLPNGIKLTVQPQSIAHVVALAGVIRSNADLQAPEGQKGVASLLGRMFNYGTAYRSRTQFQEALDAINAYERAGTSFGVVIPAKHFAEAVKLLAEQQLHPAFRPQAFQTMRRALAKSRAGYLKTPDWQETRSYLRALYPATSAHQRYYTAASVRDLTLADIKAYYHQVYRPDLTHIVVVGDVTPAHARKVIEEAFGGWHTKGPTPTVDYPAEPLNPPSRFHTADQSMVQAQVDLVQITHLDGHNPDRYIMMVGNHILGSGLHSRLMQDLRVRGGLVYGVSSSYSTSANYGFFHINFGTDPDKVEKARAMALRNLHQMQTQPVSAAELHNAQGSLLRQLILAQQSYAGMAGSLLSLSVNGYPPNSFQIATQAILNTSAADIQRVFDQYLRVDGFVTDVMGPPKR